MLLVLKVNGTVSEEGDNNAVVSVLEILLSLFSATEKSRTLNTQRRYKVCIRAKWLIIQAGVYPGFSSMKRRGVFLLPPEWNASPLQSYPQH